MSYFKDIRLSTNSKITELTETVIKVIKEKKPQSVKQLTIMLNESLGLDEKLILESVLKLQAQDIIRLENQTVEPLSLSSYLKTGDVLWYWVTIAVGVITVALALMMSASVYPFVYVRNVLGVIFVLFLPGYAFVKALFPDNMPIKVSTKTLEMIERFALSIGMSIALVSIVGLILYYTPYVLDLTAVVLSLLVLTLILASIAVARTYDIKKETYVRNSSILEF